MNSIVASKSFPKNINNFINNHKPIQMSQTKMQVRRAKSKPKPKERIQCMKMHQSSNRKKKMKEKPFTKRKNLQKSYGTQLIYYEFIIKFILKVLLITQILGRWDSVLPYFLNYFSGDFFAMWFFFHFDILSGSIYLLIDLMPSWCDYFGSFYLLFLSPPALLYVYVFPKVWSSSSSCLSIYSSRIFLLLISWTILKKFSFVFFITSIVLAFSGSALIFGLPLQIFSCTSRRSRANFLSHLLHGFTSITWND